MARDNNKRKTKGSQGFNRKNTADFLSKNATRPDVIITESGLQYLLIDGCDGEKPGLNDSVQVHQRISLVDGTIIDDTYKTSDPAVFSMEEAIAGYREGLLLMSVGSRYRFFIHPDLAWGKRGAGRKIGPNAVLIIDARLIRVI